MKMYYHFFKVLMISIIVPNALVAMQPSSQLTPLFEDKVLSALNRVFLIACEDNKSIDFFLKKEGLNIHVVDPFNGYTALHYAASNGNKERMDFLIKNGLRPDTKAYNGVTPTQIMSQLASEVLFEHGLQESLINPEIEELPKKPFNEAMKDPAFLEALKNSKLKNYKQCVIDSIAKKLWMKQLMQSLKNDSFIVFCAGVELFIDKGKGGIDLRDAQGLTLLHHAVRLKSIEWIRFLLDKGANVNAQSASGTPLYTLFSTQRISRDDSEKLEIAKMFIRRKANVNILGPKKYSVLQAAIFSQSTKCIKKLLAIDELDNNTIDEEGHNALYSFVAHYNGNDKAVLLKELFSKGCKPMVNFDGTSLMHIAAMRSNIPVLRELLQTNMNVNDRDENGRTPLHYAAQYSNGIVVRMLLSKGAQCDIADNCGKIPEDLAENNKDLLIKLAFGEHVITSILQEKQTGEKRESVLEKKIKKEKKVNKKKQMTVKVNKKSSKKTSIWLEESDMGDDVNGGKIVSEMRQEEVKKGPEEVVPQPKKQKKSFIDKAQETVVKVLTGQNKQSIAQKTYAAALNIKNSEEDKVPQAETITLVDDYLTITAPISKTSQQLIRAGQMNDNPLSAVTHYSSHVREKMTMVPENKPDFFHNFSHRVEKQLGRLAVAQNIGHSTMQYSIPATVKLPWGRTYPGEFKFMVKKKDDQKEEMIHRFFHPEKENKKTLLPPLDASKQ